MSLFARISDDIDSVLERDPAARSRLEVFLCYPGLWAVWIQHISKFFWRNHMRLIARLLSQFARFVTGVDIHPGATLGHRLFIDHATGVVIGETAIVGNDVTMYQGVTLGGTGKQTGKRHPTICDNVFIGNNANVLGNITVGENSRIGAGSVVLADVPPNSTVVGVPAHIVYRNGQRILVTDPHDIKDPLSDALIALAARVDALEVSVGGECPETPFSAEDAERAAYRDQLDRLRGLVSGGEGI
jgi:serine O-acetyltransferase